MSNFIIEYNNDKTLMIHSFRSETDIIIGDTTSEFLIDNILDCPKIYSVKLSNSFISYSNQFRWLTFDDGLFVQAPLIKLFDKSKTIFFPSFGLLRPEEIQPNPIENSIAHRNKPVYLSTFMSSIEVWDLVQSGYKLGMHGWYHLNLNLNHHDIDNSNKLKILKNDAKLCSKAYSEYVLKFPEVFITDGVLELFYCTPYNVLNDLQKLYISFLAHYLENDLKPLDLNNSYINIPKKLKIFSRERIPIENFVKEIQCHYLKELD